MDSILRHVERRSTISYTTRSLPLSNNWSESYKPYQKERRKKKKKKKKFITESIPKQKKKHHPSSTQTRQIHQQETSREKNLVLIIRRHSKRVHSDGVLLTTETLALVRNTANVRLADGVPRGDVLFHALRQAGFFFRGDGGAGAGDAGVVAVFVDFLWFINYQYELAYR